MGIKRTPVAIFTYNRPSHTERTLEALARCARLEECDLYLYCDGPRDMDATDAVAASRRVVREWSARLTAHVIEHEENLGLARSIVAGVTELCAEYGRVIVLEDDLVVQPGFLDYMLQALDLYEGESQVYQVSGYMFPVKHILDHDAFFLPLVTTWGWATWERAWTAFDWDGSGASKMLADHAVRRRFDLDGSYPYSAMLQDRLAGRNDSWGILWWWAVFRVGGLALHPRLSLVHNIGLDGSGTHWTLSAVGNQLPSEFPQAFQIGILRVPLNATASEQAFCTIKQYLGRQHKPSILRRLHRILQPELRSATVQDPL